MNKELYYFHYKFIDIVFVNAFQIEPYIPYEFTCEGMLQRVNILIEKQVGGMFVAVLTKASHF